MAAESKEEVGVEEEVEETNPPLNQAVAGIVVDIHGGRPEIPLRLDQIKINQNSIKTNQDLIKINQHSTKINQHSIKFNQFSINIRQHSIKQSIL